MNFLVRAKGPAKVKLPVEESPFQDDELAVVYNMIDSGFGSYEYMMSEEGDDEWAFQQEENGATDREEWARDEDQFNNDQGNPAHYFSNAKRLVNPWLIHFTSADPYKIMSQGFKGHDYFGLALTTHHKKGAHPGPYIFAYPLDEIGELFRYGNKAVIFQAKEAIRALHIGDDEIQAIANKKGVKNLFAMVKLNNKTVELRDKDKKPLARFDLDDAEFEKKIIGFLKKKKK